SNPRVVSARHKKIALDEFVEKWGEGGEPHTCLPHLGVSKTFRSGSVYSDTAFDSDITRFQTAQIVLRKFFEQEPEAAQYFRIGLAEPKVYTFRNGDAKCLVEPFIQNYEIFSNNWGWGARSHDFPAAISHFSYHYSLSKGSSATILAGFQGSRREMSAQLGLSGATRPITEYNFSDVNVICGETEKGGTYGPSDTGQDGIDKFFATHVCGRWCNKKWLRPGASAHSTSSYPLSTRQGSGASSSLASSSEHGVFAQNSDSSRTRHVPAESLPENNRTRYIPVQYFPGNRGAASTSSEGSARPASNRLAQHIDSWQCDDPNDFGDLEEEALSEVGSCMDEDFGEITENEGDEP
ncbi:unnamed protein product, partial [Amoebophrya sp. A25]